MLIEAFLEAGKKFMNVVDKKKPDVEETKDGKKNNVREGAEDHQLREIEGEEKHGTGDEVETESAGDEKEVDGDSSLSDLVEPAPVVHYPGCDDDNFHGWTW